MLVKGQLKAKHKAAANMNAGAICFKETVMCMNVLWRSAIVKEQLKARVTWAYFAGSILFFKGRQRTFKLWRKKRTAVT